MQIRHDSKINSLVAVIFFYHSLRAEMRERVLDFPHLEYSLEGETVRIQRQ